MTGFVVQTTIDETVYDITVDNSQGPAGTITVGTVTTGAAGSAAAVSNVGTAAAAVLDFTIPQGEPGAVQEVDGIAPTSGNVVLGALRAANNLSDVANAATARANIGAGTSSLALGTTASTALAGNTTIPSTAGQVGAVANASGQTLTLWTGTAAAYTALGSYSASTVYVVSG